MSLESWKQEFYPVPASEATGSDLEAAEHSLRKWQGLTKANLERHGLTKPVDRVLGGDRADSEFVIDASTCAMCQRVCYACDECIGAKANDLTCEEYNTAYTTFLKRAIRI